MNPHFRTHHFIPVTLLVLGLAACSRPAPPPAPAASPARGMQGMHGAGMPMDSAMMRRHMQEEDSMMARVRADVEQMRRLSPEQQQAHLPEHLAVMDSMFAMMQRHMSGGGGAMQQHQHMGEGMGMHGEMHQRMMGEMQALRADTEALRNASPAEVRERMPAHLERLERMLQMMQQMHPMQHMHSRHQGM
jgi:hypothetical protein